MLTGFYGTCQACLVATNLYKIESQAYRVELSIEIAAISDSFTLQCLVVILCDRAAQSSPINFKGL
jgi:hypothetical protein